MRLKILLPLVSLATGVAQSAQAGCVLVRTPTTTPGCSGYVGYSDGVRVGWYKRYGEWVRAGSAAKCQLGGLSSVQIGRDAVRLADGSRYRLDASCRQDQAF